MSQLLEASTASLPGATDAGTARVFVDAHVHLYACYDLVAALDRAAANFANASRDRAGALAAGVLMLTETSRDHCFSHLQQSIDSGLGPWRLARTDEDCSLIASRADRPPLVVVAGRQLVTREGLEVLALGTCCQFADGQTLAESVQQVIQSDAMAVIPWGFGKWWFRRGRIVRQWLQSPECQVLAERGSLFFGDNGGRTPLLGRPRMFDIARAHDARILPGSDPLPLASHAWRPGSFGFTLPCELDLRRPARHLQSLLKALPQQPPCYGQLTGWWGFLGNQLAMQARKRLSQSPR